MVLAKKFVLFGGRLTDMETCYKVMTRDIAKSLNLESNRFDIEPEITARLLRAGHSILELPIRFEPRSRAQGKKIGWRDGFRAIDGHMENGQLVRSVNHVFVNGAVQYEVLLNDGDILTIGESTLVGRTTEVSKHTAQVMLITDQMFAAGVRIVPPAKFDPASSEISPAVTAEDVSYGQGLLGTDLEGYLGVDLVSTTARAEEGDFIMTSGRAGDKELLFPPGLYVGKVESVSSQDIDQFKKIVVEPAMNPQDLEEVRVITDWAGRNG